MARGFALGALSGGVVGVSVGALASVMAPMPTISLPPVVSDPSSIVWQDPEITEQVAVIFPSSLDQAPDVPGVVLGQTPQPDSIEALMQIANPPALAPNAEIEEPRAPEVLAAVSPQPEPVDVFEAAETDQPTSVLTTSLKVPVAFSKVTTLSAPAPLPTPEDSWETLGLTADGEPASALRLARLNEGTLPKVTTLQPEVSPLPPAIVQAPAAPYAPVLATEDEAPNVVEQPDDVVVAQAIPAPVEAPQPRPAQAQTPAPMPAPVVSQPATGLRPSIGKPAVSLTNRSGGVVIRRPGAEPTAPAEAEPAVVEVPVADPNAPPIVRYSQPFDNADGKPLMSVVLIDGGGTAVGQGTSISDLSDFPYAISFAVDSTLADAEERVAMYRAEGFEVLSMIDVPATSRAVDVENALGAILGQMEGVVGVLEGTEAGFQSSREISDQVSAILAQSGHGLVAQAKGLNTMPNLARKNGVPADPVFRDFDGNGQGERVIRRFLDQAAFKAGQEGSVIMLGRLREETIAALLLWGLQDRAATVALAPISAVLQRER